MTNRAKIDSLVTRYYRIPLKEELSDSRHGVHTHFDLVTVTIKSGADITGIGYTYTVHAGGGAILSLIKDDIAPLLIGQPSGEINLLWQKIWKRTHYVGRGGIVSFVISAIDIALWDLKGKNENTPLWKLIGGNSNSVPAYLGGIDLHLSTEELVNKSINACERGYTALKMKVGRDYLEEDVERVRAVRKAVGKDMIIMLDANMAWSVEEAIIASKAFSESKIFWLEEPIEPDDYWGHNRVLKEGGLPIAAGESLRTVTEFKHLFNAGGVSFAEPDASNIGGITAWLEVANLAREKKLPVTSHGIHELHVHLLAGISNSSYLEVHGFGIDRFIENSPEFKNGEMQAPNSPGHGVKFKEHLLHKYEIDNAGI